jgi:hypothetical protein
MPAHSRVLRVAPVPARVLLRELLVCLALFLAQLYAFCGGDWELSVIGVSARDASAQGAAEAPAGWRLPLEPTVAELLVSGTLGDVQSRLSRGAGEPLSAAAAQSGVAETGDLARGAHQVELLSSALAAGVGVGGGGGGNNSNSESNSAFFKVVLACITRDDWVGLRENRAQVEALGRLFGDYRVVVVENDSSAAYRAALGEWTAANWRVSVISRTFGHRKRPTLSFLGQMRQLYVEELRQNPLYRGFDRVLVWDMDVAGRWPLRAMAESALVRDARFGARCFHVFHEGGGHRDVLAFRSHRHIVKYEIERAPNIVSEPTHRAVLAVTARWFAEQRAVEVDSCFGGIAAYSSEALRLCGYESHAIEDECEHLTLNRCLLDNGLSVVLDTRVALPFLLRRVEDGLLFKLLFFPRCLLQMLLPLLAGALWRFATRPDLDANKDGDKDRSTRALRTAVVSLRTGLATQLCYLAAGPLACDNATCDHPTAWPVRLVVALTSEHAIRELARLLTFTARS